MSDKVQGRRVEVQGVGGSGEEERQRMGEWRGSGPPQLPRIARVVVCVGQTKKCGTQCKGSKHLGEDPIMCHCACNSAMRSRSRPQLGEAGTVRPGERLLRSVNLRGGGGSFRSLLTQRDATLSDTALEWRDRMET